MNSTRTLAAAIQQGYVTMRGSYRVSNDFYRHCERTDTPFVRVRLKKTFAVVEVDLIGQSYRMGEVCAIEVRDLLRANHVGRRPWHLEGLARTYLYSPRVEIDNAANVASQLVAILHKPGYREPVDRRYSPEVEALDQALATGKLARSQRGQTWQVAST